MEGQRKPHLSNTQLNMLSRCGEQYRRRYILGEKIPPGVSLIVGTATDTSVNKNLESKIQTGELLTIEQVCDIARDSVVNEWEAGEVWLSDEEAALGVQAVKAEAIDKSVRLSRLHAGFKAPELRPTHVQREWRIELEGYPMDLLGYIDVQEGSSAVRDTKTSKKSPAKSIAATDNQLTLYALAVQVLDGIAPEKVALDYLVDLKTPKVITIESERDKNDFAMMLRRVEVAIEVIEKGVFIPANENDWWCDAKWCGFHSTCPYAKHPHSVNVVELTA